MTSLLASNDFVSQMTGISTFFQGYAIQFFADVTDIDVDGHGSMMRGAYISGKALIGSLAIGAFMSVYLDSNGQTAQITGKGGHLFGTIVGDNAGATVSGTGATGSGYVAGSTDLVASADGAWQHGPGTNAVAGSFQVGDGGPMLRPNGDVDITGDLNHDGSNIGFFATAPAAQTAAYTQTYATATRTHSNPTAAAVGDLVATNGGWGASTEANFDLVHSTIDQLVADMANIKQVVNQVIDDGQTYGLLQ